MIKFRSFQNFDSRSMAIPSLVKVLIRRVWIFMRTIAIYVLLNCFPILMLHNLCLTLVLTERFSSVKVFSDGMATRTTTTRQRFGLNGSAEEEF